MAKAKKSQSAAKPKPAQTTKAKPAVLNLAKKSAQLTEADLAASVSFSDLNPHRTHRWLGWAVAAIIILLGLFGGFHFVYASKIYPGVSVDGVYLGGLNKNQATQTLTAAVAEYQNLQIPVQYASTTQVIDVSQIAAQYDVTAGVAAAYSHGRRGKLTTQLGQIARGLINRSTPIEAYNFDEIKLTSLVAKIGEAVNEPVANASLDFSDTGRVGVVTDQAGTRLDTGLLMQAIEQNVSTGSNATIVAPTYSLKPTITAGALSGLKAQADTYLQGPLTLTLGSTGKTATAQVKDMIGWLKVTQPASSLPDLTINISSFAYSFGVQPVTLSLNDAAIAAYVADLSKTTDQAGQNAALTITDGAATIFQPEKTGYTLDQPAAVVAIKAALSKPAADRSLALNVKVTQPDVTAASLNDLGINQLISEGVTTFPGSPATRMQNIRVGASKFNGILIKPDDTFSFESLLGNVDAASGYAPALVILGDHEEYQYGGGMCQVSSTAYRAALLAGLPIVERISHSFAVGYYTAPYGVPGVDATVFDSSVDLKFKNDTGHYILIQTVLSGTTLKFDFYGTKTKTGVIHPPTFIDPVGGAGWNPTVPSTTVFTRDVLDLAGNVIKTDIITTHYKSSLDFPVQKELN